MRLDEAEHALGKRARLNYATGGEPHAEGTVMGYSVVPQIMIETDDGRQIWWRHDLTESIPEPSPVTVSREAIDALDKTLPQDAGATFYPADIIAAARAVLASVRGTDQ